MDDVMLRVPKNVADATVERMADLEGSNERLAKNLERAEERLEKAEALNDLLLERAIKAEAMADARQETIVAYKKAIAGLIQGIDPVHTFDALDPVSLILSAATDFEKRGERCQVQLSRGSNDRPVGIILGVLNKSALNGESSLRAIGDARLLSLPREAYGTNEQYETQQGEKP